MRNIFLKNQIRHLLVEIWAKLSLLVALLLNTGGNPEQGRKKKS